MLAMPGGGLPPDHVPLDNDVSSSQVPSNAVIASTEASEQPESPVDAIQPPQHASTSSPEQPAASPATAQAGLAPPGAPLCASGAAGGFRASYGAHGVDGYYEKFGAGYANPHEREIRGALKRALAAWPQISLDRVLDLACGSGEATAALEALAPGCAVVGCDPYTHSAFEARTGRPALRHSFEDVEAGCLEEEERFTTIVCCYALHLAEPSRLVCLGCQLALAAPHLLVVSPHKRPHISEAMGWAALGEVVVERVHVRAYQSLMFAG